MKLQMTTKNNSFRVNLLILFVISDIWTVDIAYCCYESTRSSDSSYFFGRLSLVTTITIFSPKPGVSALRSALFHKLRAPYLSKGKYMQKFANVR